MSIPANQLTHTRIFHITALENLSKILEMGALFSKNHRPCDCVSIANEDIQNKRASHTVPLAPYGCLHDYVPFYFAPRSPMLMANHKTTIANAHPQSEIIHIVSTAQRVSEAGQPFVFYDHHALKIYATPYNDLSDLDKIDWRVFFEAPIMEGYSKYFHNVDVSDKPHWIKRKDIRQAEFLIHEKIHWQFINGIATMNETKAEHAREILRQFGMNTPVLAKPDWYF